VCSSTHLSVDHPSCQSSASLDAPLSMRSFFSAWPISCRLPISLAAHIVVPMYLLYLSTRDPPVSGYISSCFYRAMHFSAKRGIGIACRPSVTLVDCDHMGWKSWKLIARTISLTPSLFVAQRPSVQGNIWGRLEVGWENGVLEHKSGNISETRKDRQKVTMGGL